MAKVFTKKDLIAAVADKTKLPKTLIARVYDATTDVQKQKLKSGYVVKTQNGQIKIITRKARRGVNPQTGKEIIIPACVKPKYLFSKDFKRGF